MDFNRNECHWTTFDSGLFFTVCINQTKIIIWFGTQYLLFSIRYYRIIYLHYVIIIIKLCWENIWGKSSSVEHGINRVQPNKNSVITWQIYKNYLNATPKSDVYLLFLFSKFRLVVNQTKRRKLSGFINLSTVLTVWHSFIFLISLISGFC